MATISSTTSSSSSASSPSTRKSSMSLSNDDEAKPALKTFQNQIYNNDNEQQQEQQTLINEQELEINIDNLKNSISSDNIDMENEDSNNILIKNNHVNNKSIISSSDSLELSDMSERKSSIESSSNLAIGQNGSNNNVGGMGGLSLMQSSPPPHSYRHSRAYRHFKNPPQPHMCIKTTTETGEELFINVLSWTRIVIPQEPSDPIPLYGGMRVSCFKLRFFQMIIY